MSELRQRLLARKAELAAQEAPKSGELRRKLRQRKAEIMATENRERLASAGVEYNASERLQAQQDMDAQAEQAIARTATTRGEAFTLGASQGATMNFGDEAVGLVDPEGQERLRGRIQTAQTAYPGMFTAGEVAGSVAALAPAGGLAVAKAPASMAGRVVGGVTAGGAGGAIEGAVSGYGRGETPQERQSEAVEGGVVGGISGGVLGGAAPLAAAGLRNMAEYLRRSDVGIIAQELGISKPSARIVKGYLENEDFDAAERVLMELGGDGMLADAGESSAQLLDTAMATGGKALRQGRDAVTARTTASQSAISDTFNRTLGLPVGVKSAGKTIAKKTAPARKKAFDRAFAQPVDYASEGGMAIEAVLDRVPPKTLRKAIDEANEAMQEASTRNMQILADIADDGSVTFREMPNVQQLHEIKIALQSQVELNDVGQMTAGSRRAQRLAGDLRDLLGKNVQGYSTAMRLGGDKIAQSNALGMGRKVLTDSVSVEDVAELMDGASPAQREAFAVGLRANLEQVMSRVKAVASDPDVDAREARKVIQEMTSRLNRDKVRIALGKKKANRLFSVLDREARKFTTQARVARNSATAIRTAGRDAVKQELEPGPLGSLASGEPVQATRRILQLFTNTTPQARGAKEAEHMAEIARALTQVRGEDAVKALGLVRKAMAGQKLTSAQSSAVANAVIGSGALSAHQSITQSQ